MLLTAEMLLKNKEIIEEKTGEKNLKIKVKSFEEEFEGSEIEIKSIGMQRFFEIRKQCDNSFAVNRMVCYECITSPNLKDKELQKGLGVKSNPYAIVEKIFTPSEINIISDKIAEISGIESDLEKSKKLIEEVKNE